MSLYARFSALLDGILDELVAEGRLPADANRKAVAVEPPRDASHGDLATNAAMVLAKAAGTNPRALAEALLPKLEAIPAVTSVEIAGPGFINLRLAEEAWRDELTTILAEGEEYGLSSAGANERVNVEYVSANPTGPMHMGHCRGAVVGDALARLLEAAGFRVTKEYYVNDAGSQVDTLARSAHLRYREKLGADIGEIPEGLYPGDYLKPVGAILAAEYGDRFAEAPESEWLELFKAKTVAAMLDLIRHDLGLLDIHHDLFASEAELQASGKVERGAGGAARQGAGLRRRARAAEEPRRTGRVGAGRADPVPLDPVRRRPGPADEEVGRQLDLFRGRRRLPFPEGAEVPTIWSTSGAPTMPGR